MDAEEITQLAFVLRRNGDKVLNGQGKLSLSVSLLNNLNRSFNLITEQQDALSSSFQVINSNTNVEIFSDLRFLHDFLQRSVSLKLILGSNNSDDTQEVVDISIFRNLKFLELHKVRLSSVIGIQHLRARLQMLVCVRNVSSMKEILEECGADKSAGFLWNELKEAVFSHNGICALDSSLEFVPWLHTLDLSHNNIKCAHELNCLSNLKNLNLSYNKLESVPQFNGQICSRLQVRIFLLLFNVHENETITYWNSWKPHIIEKHLNCLKKERNLNCIFLKVTM